MTTPTSLPACAKNHPGIPSNVLISVCTRATGVVYDRPYCTVCALNPARAGERQEAGRRGALAPSAVQTYGVVKLCWTPPEMLVSGSVAR